MKRITPYLFLFLALSYSPGSYAQSSPEYVVHYPVAPDFWGIGLESNPIIELTNHHAVYYRFEKDSTQSERHFVRLWSADTHGTIQWDKRIDIGQHDSTYLSGSLCSLPDGGFAFAYKYLTNGENSRFEILELDENGTALWSAKSNLAADILNIYGLTSRNDTLYISGSGYSSNVTKAFIGIIPRQNIENAGIYWSDDLESARQIYFDPSGHMRIAAVTDSDQTVDHLVDISSLQSAGFSFDQFIFRQLVSDALGNRYYAGSYLGSDPFYPVLGLCRFNANGQPDWFIRRDVSGEAYHGTTPDAILYDAQSETVVVSGYSSVPFPVTSLSQITNSGQVQRTVIFDSYHPFNYNYGGLLKHFDGTYSIFRSGGNLNFGVYPPYLTTLIHFDDDWTISCDGSVVQDNWQVDTLSLSPHSATWYTGGSLDTATVILQDTTMWEVIICPDNLGVTELDAEDLSIFPVPFSTDFTVRTPGNKQVAAIVIVDASGRQLPVSTEASGNSILVKTTGLPAGFYQCFLHFTDGQFISKKVVKN